MNKLINKEMQETSSVFYDNLRKNEWKSTADYGPTTRARYDIIEKLVKQNSNQNPTILDVGCGTGNLLLKLKNAGL